MAGNLQAPGAQTPLVDGDKASRSWFTFFSLVGKRLSAVGSLATVSTADATDPASTQALVNELKAKVNAILESQQQ